MTWQLTWRCRQRAGPWKAYDFALSGEIAALDARKPEKNKAALVSAALGQYCLRDALDCDQSFPPTTFFNLPASKNCSSSVEPVSAVVDDFPCWIACVTWSK